jgi:NAD(P)-dependent dehydrogenase (short-subunit alcohol dehydrogenase family)
MRALIDFFRRKPAVPQLVGTGLHAAGDAPGARVLVCGASGAIGAAVATAFAAAGARVFLHAHRNGERVAALARELHRARPDLPPPHCASADLRDAAAAQALLREACVAMGGIDVVVTAIGGAKDAPLPLVDARDIAASIDDNLLPVINVCDAYRALPPGPRGGRIVNVASVTGLVGQPMRVAYGAAKGAVISYTKSVARELAASGITANCVAPQVIDGGLAKLMNARVRAVLLANTPIGRACTPQDVAHGVTYLASPAASFVTGTVLTISGGLVTW